MTTPRPTKFPTAWPTDKLSHMTNSAWGWIIAHPARNPHIWNGEKWEEVRDPQEQAA